MTRRLRIAVATAGRFHVLDLARELHAAGHDVKFYSYVPHARARRFGLPDGSHVPLLPFALPALAWGRVAPNLAPRLRERLLYAALNAGVIQQLRPCDVFIGMSGIYLEAGKFAKRRFGARIWLERGSRHILSQDEILAALPGAERPSAYAIRRELEGYAIADRVVIPSAHVEESFRRDPESHAKLFHNPYGVSLTMFPLVARAGADGPITFLFVGSWSLRKGCDVLEDAIRRLADVRLVHVGSIGDARFPSDDSRFIHMDAVPQAELSDFYAKAHAFVLASREEGLSMVLSQALASGLRVVCTDRTGGADLAHTPELAARVTVVPHDDIDALVLAMADLRDRLRRGEILTPLSEADRETLSWTAYGRRYSEQLSRDMVSL